MEHALQSLRREAETAAAAVAAAAVVVATNQAAADHPSRADLDPTAESKIAELERQNAEQREARDREVAALTGEVKRLKAAIAQLVGIGAAT